MYKPVSLGTHVNIFPMQGSASFSMERANLSKLTGANLRNMGQRWGVGGGPGRPVIGQATFLLFGEARMHRFTEVKFGTSYISK